MGTVPNPDPPRERYVPGELVDVHLTCVPVSTYYTTTCNDRQYTVLAVTCPGSDGRITALVLESPAVLVTRREVA